MNMNEHTYWLAGIGILVGMYLALRNGVFTHGTQQFQPRGEVVGMVDYGNLTTVMAEPQHHIDPDGVVNLPVRYPVHCGENITTLITHGFDPLFQNKPADVAWMVMPPSEVSI
jgi:hypothetical protein